MAKSGTPGRIVLTLATAGALLACASSDLMKPPPAGDDDPEPDAAAPGGRGGGAGGRGGAGGPGGSGPGGSAGSPATPDAGAQGGSGGGGAPDASGTGGSPATDAGRDSQAAGGSGGGGAGGSGAGGNSGGNFSFFVTSFPAMKELSKSELGFGGDLRFGEMTGLAGADKICRTIAEKAVPGSGQKTWRAFLSTAAGGPNGGPVHAIDRIGEGPWYDRMGRLFSMNKAGLLAGPRPMGAPAVVADFPNELGVPNKQGVDNHDTLTGSNKMGRYPGDGTGTTCNDWTSSAAMGQPYIGHSWPRSPSNLSFGGHWISDHRAPGCAPGYNLSNGPGMSGGGRATVGGSGGYGGLYCFAILTP